MIVGWCSWHPPLIPDSRICRRCRAILSQPRLLPFNLGLALTITAAVLSLPALLDPIFVVHFYGRERADLVSTGVAALWTGSIWPLALMVGILAIVIPVVWICTLAVVFDVLSSAAGHRGWALCIAGRAHSTGG